MNILEAMKYDINKEDQNVLMNAAVQAFNAEVDKADVRPGQGCGRAYVSIGKLRKNSKSMKTLIKAGFKVTSNPESKFQSIYIGYDNSTGVELAKAKAVAKVFNDLNIPAGVDAQGD